MANMRSRLKGGNALARVQQALKQSHRRFYLVPPENPHGVPRAVMKQLAAERLPAEAINGRLQELLAGFRGGYTEEVLQFDATASKPPEACDAVSGGSSN